MRRINGRGEREKKGMNGGVRGRLGEKSKKVI